MRETNMLAIYHWVTRYKPTATKTTFLFNCLRWYFSNFKIDMNYLEILLKYTFQFNKYRREPEIPNFLTSSQLMPMLLSDAHFEWLCFREPLVGLESYQKLSVQN